MTPQELIIKITKRIEELTAEEYEQIGIRSSDEDNETVDTVSVVWEDGERDEDDELNGLCCTDIEGDWVASHIIKEDSFLSKAHWYGFQKHLYIVAGNHASYGDDHDELIIEPEIVELIK